MKVEEENVSVRILERGKKKERARKVTGRIHRRKCDVDKYTATHVDT